MRPIAMASNASKESMAVYVMGFKGDWKYLCQLFNLVRNPSSEQPGDIKTIDLFKIWWIFISNQYCNCKNYPKDLDN